jgi:hypothetical protein
MLLTCMSNCSSFYHSPWQLNQALGDGHWNMSLQIRAIKHERRSFEPADPSPHSTGFGGEKLRGGSDHDLVGWLHTRRLTTRSEKGFDTQLCVRGSTTQTTFALLDAPWGLPWSRPHLRSYATSASVFAGCWQREREREREWDGRGRAETGMVEGVPAGWCCGSTGIAQQHWWRGLHLCLSVVAAVLHLKLCRHWRCHRARGRGNWSHRALPPSRQHHRQPRSLAAALQVELGEYEEAEPYLQDLDPSAA